jgi:hypothetical protein
MIAELTSLMEFLGHRTMGGREGRKKAKGKGKREGKKSGQ